MARCTPPVSEAGSAPLVVAPGSTAAAATDVVVDSEAGPRSPATADEGVDDDEDKGDEDDEDGDEDPTSRVDGAGD